MEEENKVSVPRWLEELQQRSWEPEILLSGIVLYGMFKVPDILDRFLAFFKLNIFDNSQDIDNLVALFKMGIYWLIGGLILHLICRGIWIGMVGLSYTFPNGIQRDKLKYQGKFQEKLESIPSYERIVIRLEKVSSSLFSLSFMLFMSLIGGYLFFFILLILPFTIGYLGFKASLTGTFFTWFQVYVFFVLGLGILGLIDFLSLGYFRRFKWLAKVYWPLHKFISALTLSRLYRPIYYGIVSNFNRWLFFALLTIFTFVSIFGAGTMTDNTYPGDSSSMIELWGNTRGYDAYAGYYEDQNAAKPSVVAQIPSDVISGDVIRLFVVARASIEDEIKKHTPLDSLEKVYPDTVGAALDLLMIGEFYKISINDQLVDLPKWYYHYRTSTRQRGYITYVSIADLEEGLYELKVNVPETVRSTPFAVIPFYRDVTSGNSETVRKPEEEKQESDFQPKPFGGREKKRPVPGPLHHYLTYLFYS
jgi:hypothetical protein